LIAGWRCAVCGASVDIATPFAWRCPNATLDDPHHVLHLVGTADDEVNPGGDAWGDINPMLRYGPRLAWWAFARANGMTVGACEALTHEVAGEFRITPFQPSERLSAELGSNVWVKDETGNVAGSQKARHLIGILLHLRAAETLGLLNERPPLAIASCGNAALAAATLAARADWPIDVYVPTWMDEAFGRRLDELGARIHRCERRPDDPPGDPAMLRFREARRSGAIPFTVQGPENGACLDAGRTIGWEIAEQAAAADVTLTRAFAQVGGGAFAACLGAGLGREVRLDTVQAEGCAPLAEAWERVAGVDRPERYWSHIMQPWPGPHSLADGILDDETYDWIADVEAMVESGGQPVVASESDIVRAHDLATQAGFDVSPTGSSGLAGALTVAGELTRADHVAIVMTGVAR
jgi:threonine dehydratase